MGKIKILSTMMMEVLMQGTFQESILLCDYASIGGRTEGK